MLTKAEKKAMGKLVAKRNDHIKSSFLWENIEFGIYLLLMVVIAFSIRTAVLEPWRVRGSSMEATLLPGDYMLIEKVSYIFDPMDRGDVVVCYYPNNDEYTCVKRIIGLSGDTVQIQQGRVSVNGTPIEEPYVVTGMTPKHDGTYIVEEGCVFVMGDNRLVSRDSTNGMVGSIPRERVIGRVSGVVLPISRAKVIYGMDYGL
ncbi:MAG: signal peptidase I [Clostridia bacterium]|nr:signal peptidase I [Clostridia bacterium]